MHELDSVLSNIEKDSSYRIIQVIKDTEYGKTEKVINGNHEIFIRKYFKGIPEKTMREFGILSKLNHTSLPEIYDYYELSGESVLIEKYIDGIKLSEFIQYCGKLPYEKALDVALKLCDVILYLHEQNPAPVIHRDIKPDNIIYTKDGQIKLIDFDAARYYNAYNTKDTVYVGTLGYAPPEQFGFGQTDIRTDIYAIGMTMLHMITGNEPERGNVQKSVIANVPLPLQKIISKAIEFDPAKRYDNVSRLIMDLKNITNKITDFKSENKIKNITNFQKNAVFIYPKYLVCFKLKRVAVMATLMLYFLIAFMGSVFDICDLIIYANLDYFIKLVYDFLCFHFFVGFCLILGLNLFNINERFRFFHRKRVIKKIAIFFIITIAIGSVLPYLQNYYSEAYKLQNLAGS